MIRLAALLLFFATPMIADTIVAARTIPARSLIGPNDILIHAQVVPGAASDPASIIGMEARVALFAGRPIRQGDVGFPATVERNQIVMLHYQNNGLNISTEARALGRAGPGDLVRVMNVASRTTVTARVGVDGGVYVQR